MEFYINIDKGTSLVLEATTAEPREIPSSELFLKSSRETNRSVTAANNTVVDDRINHFSISETIEFR